MTDQHSALIKQRMASYLAGREFGPYFERLHGPVLAWWILAVIAPLTIIGIPLGLRALKKIWAGDYESVQLRNRYRRLGKTGEIVFTYVIVTNSSLKHQENVNAPALVAGNFNGGRDDLRIMKLRDTLASHALGLETTPETQPLAKLLRDLDYTFGRRRLIPPQFTGGIAVTAFDLQIIGEYLPTKKLEMEIIPCIAEPGEKGLICMIPYFIIQDVMAELGDESDDDDEEDDDEKEEEEA